MGACAAGVKCSVCLLVCLFVHQFVCRFLIFSGVLGLFTISFTFVKMALVNKGAFVCSVFESDHLEAQKKLFLATWMLVKLSFLALTVNFNLISIFLCDDHYCSEYNLVVHLKLAPY